MLSDIVHATNLTEEFCADLIGAAPDHFNEWMSGKRSVPRFLIPELISVFGATREHIQHPVPPEISPVGPVWFKLRTENKVNTSDLEMIGMTRKLCFRIGQFFAFKGYQTDAYRSAFDIAREGALAYGDPEEQGRVAATIIRDQFGWSHGATGIGELLRPNLRHKGIVVVESSFRDAVVNGCCFTTAGPKSEMVCLFVNNYGINWFRRNAVLLHELAHAIFDLSPQSLSIDYKAENQSDSSELRAEAFSRECLLPKRVLVHYQNHFGFKWESLTPVALAHLIAECHAPQQMILKAALDYALINNEQFIRCSQFECAAILEEITPHALSTKDYAKRLPPDQKRWLLADRSVKFGSRKLVLPASYVQSLIECVESGEISTARAAELSLMDCEDFSNRFKAFFKPQQQHE